ncbi:MAG: cellulase, partial [Rhodoferax sp.]|nr:cellulase [Rhodoferax sp.]
SAPRGFVPDWVIFDAKQGFLPDSGGEEKGQGAYNAIRVYLWAGMLRDARRRKALLPALLPMARYTLRDQGYPARSIDIASWTGYGLASAGFSAALLPTGSTN